MFKILRKKKFKYYYFHIKYIIIKKNILKIIIPFKNHIKIKE
jgi:hypothetical protein